MICEAVFGATDRTNVCGAECRQEKVRRKERARRQRTRGQRMAAKRIIRGTKALAKTKLALSSMCTMELAEKLRLAELRTARVQIRAFIADWKKAHPEIAREIYLEKIRRKSKVRYHADRAKAVAKVRRWKRQNPDKVRDQHARRSHRNAFDLSDLLNSKGDENA
ncbi:hypothetical protein ACVDG5_018440 [Mesorhizobium sp. ORM6]